MDYLAIAILFLLSFVRITNAAWYVGNLSLPAYPTFFPIDATVPSTCTVLGAHSPYASFRVIATPGLYYITGVGKSTLQVEVHEDTFDPSNPCSSLIAVFSASSNSLKIDDALFLDEKTYRFVVTSVTYIPTSSTDLTFSVHVDKVEKDLTSEFSTSFWKPPLPPYDGYTCQDSSDVYSFTSHQFTNTLSSNIDIVVIAFNATAPRFFEFDISIYETSDISYLLGGTSSNPSSGCAQLGLRFSKLSTQSVFLPRSTRSHTYQLFTLLDFPANPSVSYTIVLSNYGGDVDSSYFGIITRPTLVDRLSNSTGFYAPQVNLLQSTTTCTAGTDSKLWGTRQFSADSSYYVIDVESYFTDSNFDSICILYSGPNTGEPPANCPTAGIVSFVKAADTGDLVMIQVSDLDPATTYTIVTSTYSNPQAEGYRYVVYFYGGTFLDPTSITSGEVSTGNNGTTVSVSSQGLVELDRSTIIAIAAGGGGGLICIVVVVVVIVMVSRKKKTDVVELEARKSSKEDKRASNSSKVERVTQEEFDDYIIQYSEITLQKKLGEGAFGAVYKGEYKKTKVAIKVISATKVIEEQIAEFKNEAKLMKSLPPHNNVVFLRGISLPPDPVCIVLEYCKGGSLHNYLKQGSVPDSKKIQFAKDIARGMLHLHTGKRGFEIIHRDLAARNILLKEGDVAAVADFGMARMKTDKEDEQKTRQSIGPLKWMAPESLKNNIYSKKSDVFSYGIVLWEIVTQSTPWSDESAVSAAAKVLGGERLPIPADCPSILSSVMQMCWKQEPSERPDFEEILEKFKGGKEDRQVSILFTPMPDTNYQVVGDEGNYQNS